MPRLPLLMLGLALLAGCGNDDSGEGGGTAATGSSLTGVPWQVTSGLDTPGWEQVAPSATFAGGHMTGSTGCNQYSAAYKTDGDQLTLGQVASTKKACPAPAGAVEAEYLRALDQIASWRIDGDELVLGDAGGQEVLRLREASLTGAWVATAFLQGDAVSSPLPGSEVTAHFGADGALSGSAGCNRYAAKYTLTRGALRIAAPTATEKSCTTPTGIMDQETAYLAALPQSRSYQLDGQILKLLTQKGTIVATYTRSG